MITFRKRLGSYTLLWFLTALAFAFAPFAPTEYPELQERVQAFFEAPLMLAVGLTTLLPWHGAFPAGIFAAIVLYLVGHAVVTLTRKQSRSFFVLCAVHLLQTAVAVVSFVQFSWHDLGG